MGMYKLITATLIFLVSGLVYAETIWVDVRSVDEYQQSHIAGDLHIPYQSIVTGMVKTLNREKCTHKTVLSQWRSCRQGQKIT
jgi:hypothetical protein